MCFSLSFSLHSKKKKNKTKHGSRTSLVTQWSRTCLEMQETWVQSMVLEDPTCHRATKPVHNDLACAEPGNYSY